VIWALAAWDVAPDDSRECEVCDRDLGACVASDCIAGQLLVADAFASKYEDELKNVRPDIDWRDIPPYSLDMRKPNLKVVSRHGATQPEDERARKQVLLRLSPDLVAELDAFAKENGWPRSHLVEASLRLVLKHWGAELDVTGGPTIGDLIADELPEIEE
jgi:hypothetical protein